MSFKYSCDAYCFENKIKCYDFTLSSENCQLKSTSETGDYDGITGPLIFMVIVESPLSKKFYLDPKVNTYSPVIRHVFSFTNQQPVIRSVPHFKERTRKKKKRHVLGTWSAF
jgi:hypothetical protein